MNSTKYRRTKAHLENGRSAIPIFWVVTLLFALALLLGWLFLWQTSGTGPSAVRIPLIVAGGGLELVEEANWDEELLQEAREEGAFIGCGDSLFYLEEDAPAKVDPMTHVYERLFDMEAVVVHENIEYINPIGFHTDTRVIDERTFEPLSFDTVSVADGVAQVDLSGDYVTVGTCEPAATEAVLEFAAQQFEEVEEVDIFLNGEEMLFTNIDVGSPGDENL